jgi:HSP20 family molecular chaperone IbpA
MIALRTKQPVESKSIFEPFFGFDDFGVKQTNRNAYKVLESENGVEILFSLPGFSKNEVNIILETGQLKVEASLPEGGLNHFLNDNQQFVFNIDQQKFDFDSAEANLENGVLSVKIPQAKAYSNKRVLKIK